MSRRGGTALLLLAALAVAGCGGTLKEQNRTGTPDFNGAKAQYDRGNYLDAIPDFKAYIEQYPGTDLTDDALYDLGECYIREKDYTLASAQFDRLLRDFPTSPLVKDGLFELARCDDLQSHPAPLDQTETERALSRYNQFVDQYPDHPHLADARARIQVLRDRLAEKLFRTGRLYYKLHQNAAASLTLERMLADYPDSRWVRDARSLLTRVQDRRAKDNAARNRKSEPERGGKKPGNEAGPAP